MADQKLDPTRPLVMTTGANVNGHDLMQRTAIEIVEEESDKPRELTVVQAEQLLNRGVLIYADRAVATPVETPRQTAERLADREELENGRVLIRAPWLTESEQVAKGAADKRYAEVVEAGEQLYRETLAGGGPVEAAVLAVTATDGISVEETGSNGYYTVTAPGREPEKIRGRQNAEDRAAELRSEIAAETSPPVDSGSGQQGSETVGQTAGEQGGSPITDLSDESRETDQEE
jgi:hypothetical protein